MGPEIGAHIAAVPLKGQDSQRAECGISPRTNGLGTGPKWLVDCSVRVEFSFVLRESDLFADLNSSGGKGGVRRSQGIERSSDVQLAKGSFMAIFLAILDSLFGCHHVHLSRVFTLQGETYRVCCDCGARFAYSLETMSIEHRLPLIPVLARFRIA